MVLQYLCSEKMHLTVVIFYDIIHVYFQVGNSALDRDLEEMSSPTYRAGLHVGQFSNLPSEDSLERRPTCAMVKCSVTSNYDYV